jgi:hypothetical protein
MTPRPITAALVWLLPAELMFGLHGDPLFLGFVCWTLIEWAFASNALATESQMPQSGASGGAV